MKNIIFILSALIFCSGCVTTKKVTEDKKVVKTDSIVTTDVVEKIDTTATIEADTANYNNLPITIFTDTTDTMPVVFENSTTKVIIRKKKNKKFDLQVIKKEEKVTLQFYRHTKTKLVLHKMEKTTHKEKQVKTSYGPVYVIGGISLLLLLLLLYYLYRRWKKGLLKFPF